MEKKEVKITLLGHLSRMIILTILLLVCIVCLAGEPIDNENWDRAFWGSKLIGFGTGYIMYKLYCLWDKKGYFPENESNVEDDEQ